jgi:hypothetical protein
LIWIKMESLIRIGIIIMMPIHTTLNDTVPDIIVFMHFFRQRFLILALNVCRTQTMIVKPSPDGVKTHRDNIHAYIKSVLFDETTADILFICRYLMY